MARLISWPLAATLSLAAIAAGTASWGAVAIQTEIEEELTCQCGCGLTVHRCNHVNCPSAIPLRKEIAGLIGQGLSREEVLDHFRRKYGEKILSAPTTRGFNLTAWVAPFLAVLLASAFVVRVAARWRRRERVREPAAAALPEKHGGELRAKLEEELDKLET